jgi:hypothetical protein
VLNIKDQVYISLKIDGTEIQYINLKELTMAEGNGAYAPTIKLVLDDPTSVLSRTMALSEANTITVTLSRNTKERVQTRKYRIFSPVRNNPTRNPLIEIVGLLDCPKYFSASARESHHSAITTDVLSKVASACGLKYVGPDNGRATNDKQIWLNVCSTRAMFIHQVVRHGYMDDKSCMSAVVTSMHELRYKNVVDTVNTPADKIQFVFTHNAQQSSLESSKKTYLVKETKDKSHSGAMSNWVNYGSTRGVNDIDGTQKNKKKCEVKVPGSYVAVNQTVAEDISRSRVDYAVIDCTNTHPKYQDALYQNQKILGIFSEVVSLLVDVVTDVQLYDPIIYRQADADIKAKVRNEDIYIVVGKTIVVRGGVHYAERIVCARPSLTMKGNTELKSSLDSGKANSSVGAFGSSQSIIASPGIDKNATGSCIANMGKVSSVSSELSKVSEANASLLATVKKTVTAVSNASNSIYNVSNAIKSGNVDHILSSVSSAISPLSSTISEVQKVKNSVTQASQSISGLISSVDSLSTTVVNATITSKNGPVEVLSNSLKILSSLNAVSGQMTRVASQIPQPLRSDPQCAALTSSVNTCNTQVQSIRSQNVALWNMLVSILTKTTKPTKVSNNNWYDKSFIQASSSKSNDSGKHTEELTAELTKTPPSYMPEDGCSMPNVKPDELEKIVAAINTHYYG